MELERLLWYIVPVGLAIAGAYMVIRPAATAMQNRDNPNDASPPSAAEIWQMRAIGLVVLIGGIYGFYRMLGGTWGAGPPDADFDSLVKLLHALGIGAC